MKQYFDAIGKAFTYDPGQRHLVDILPVPDLQELARQLADAGCVFVITGFPIPSKNTGETDGPSGAANIAAGLCAAGRQVCVVTDPLSYPLLQAACNLYAPDAQVLCVPFEGAAEACAALVEQYRPTHVIALERPGRSPNGHYHNMHAHLIDDFVADTEPLFLCGATTVAVGDGGNELGMGPFRETILPVVPHGDTICACQPCDFPLIAGVSNWWGWGIRAILSLHTGRDLMPTEAQELQLLQAVVDAGGVDGITREPVLTVDGLEPETHFVLLRQLKEIVAQGLCTPASV